jgi:hypothetical protein
MSIFQHTLVDCPGCERTLDFERVVSDNAGRRPDLREAILNGSFQRERCPHCGVRFRVDPELTYIDLGRGQYICAWPVSKRRTWQQFAARSQGSFDRAFGALATGEARALGATLEFRVAFGWPALTEKLLARAAGHDDRTLEVAKHAIVSRLETAPLPGQQELRLVTVDDDALTFGWVHADGDRLGACLRAPRTLIAEIESDVDAWRELREDVTAGPVVDFQRDMLAA